MSVNSKILMILALMSVGSNNFAATETVNASQHANHGNSCDCKYNNQESHNFDHPSYTKGSIEVGKDKAGKPISFSYLKKGNAAPNAPTFICIEWYTGKSSWGCQLEELSKTGVVYAVDPLGYGESSQNNPTALDGINNQIGYSYSQQAFFLRTFLKKLKIKNSPIVYVGVDTMAPLGVKYCLQYATDKFAFSKFVVINSALQSIVSDDPCQLSYLTTAQAAGLSAFFAVDPCAAVCNLLNTSFTEPACYTQARKIYNEAVNYIAAQPAPIFERITTGTSTEDVSPLLAQITIPVLCLYSVEDNNDLLSRKAQGLIFFGYCPSCPQPANGTVCPNSPEIFPVKDCRFITFPRKGTLLHRIEAQRVNEYIKQFALDCDIQCCVCPINANIPVVCPVCPQP